MKKKYTFTIFFSLLMFGFAFGQENNTNPGTPNFYDTLEPMVSIEALGDDGLVYCDYTHGNDGVVDALVNLGYDVTLATSWPDFDTKLASGVFELAVAFHQNEGGSSFNVPTAQAFIAGGGKMIFATWGTWDLSADAAQAALFEAALTANNNLTTVTITDPDLGTGLPNPIILSNAGWGIFSLGMTAVGAGEVLATYENGNAAIIRGNGGKTIILGYLSDSPPLALRQQLFENIVTSIGDIVPPEIACPGDIEVHADPYVCGAVVNYTLPEFSDDQQEVTEDFTGDFAPGNWTLITNGGTGSVDLSGAPAAVTLHGSDGGTEDPVMTELRVIVPEDGTVRFDWSYSTLDWGPGYDPFGYVLNGVFHQLTNDFGAILQSGNITVPLELGDQFSFAILSHDDVYGYASNTSLNFSFTTGVRLEQTAGLPSGSTFPIGTTTNTFLATDAAGNTAECSFDVTVNERPTTLTYFGPLAGQYSDEVLLQAKLVDDVSGEGVYGKLIVFDLGEQSTSEYTDYDGVVQIMLKLDQPIGLVDVEAVFDGDCPYLPSKDLDPFTIKKELACANYSGVRIASTGCLTCNDATVLLAATITDWPDGYPGDITTAKVTFVKATGTFPFFTPISPELPVGLVNEGDNTVGSVNFWWDVSLTDLIQFKTELIWIKVSGNYWNFGICTDPTLITIFRPGPEFITGGGYLILEEPAGTIGADVGSHNNFGFNVKYNKRGTTLQGNINIMVRKTVDDEELVYHIKGNKMVSLSVLDKFAVFTCQANVTDMTNPELPKAVEGNCTLKINMIDKGEPGTDDLLGITVFDKNGGLYFSSLWKFGETQMQSLGNGNLAVHSGTPDGGGGGGKKKSGEVLGYADNAVFDLSVYPNPFTDRVTFEFIPAENSNARIDILDLNGRLIRTIFDQPVDAGNSYQANFEPGAAVDGLYLYRATIGNDVSHGKLLKK